jgi:DNA-directed RNA polymerase subunit RPC12/RpoP
MICPQCQFEFDEAATHCPECGVRVLRKVSGIVKTSAVMIAAGDGQSFYRSVQEVPEPLRRTLIETTNSENSGMIVIADRAGREQWTEIVAQREAQQEAQSSPPAIAPPSIEPAAPAASGFAGLSWTAWAGILLFLAAAALIASVFRVSHF